MITDNNETLLLKQTISLIFSRTDQVGGVKAEEKWKQCFLTEENYVPTIICYLSLELICEKRWGTPKHCNLLVCLNVCCWQIWQFKCTFVILIISFPCPNGVPVQVWSKSTNWFRDRVQTRLIFTVFIVWWPWKLGQCHQNLINSFIPMIQYIKFGQKPSFGSRDRAECRQAFFLVKIWHSKCWCDLENELKVTKI